jgi:hypothetical protein
VSPIKADRVSVTTEGRVATVTLVRETKHNALDVAMLEAITAAAEEALLQSRLIRTPNQHAAVRARMTRTPANFRDPTGALS